MCISVHFRFIIVFIRVNIPRGLFHFIPFHFFSLIIHCSLDWYSQTFFFRSFSLSDFFFLNLFFHVTTGTSCTQHHYRT